MNEEELVQVAQRLEGSMTALAGEIQAERQAREEETAELRSYGQRNRRMLWGLVAAILLALASAGFAVGASLQAKDATSQAKRTAENSRISCEVGNEGRRLQTQLWTYVLDLSAQNPNLTAYQKKQIALFRGYIAVTYAPRNCNATPTIPPGTVTPSR